MRTGVLGWLGWADQAQRATRIGNWKTMQLVHFSSKFAIESIQQSLQTNIISAATHSIPGLFFFAIMLLGV